MSDTPEKFALEDLTDEQKFDSYDGCPRCDEQLLIALDGYQDSRVWGTGGLVAATARAAKQAAYFAEKVATLETKRDEARETLDLMCDEFQRIKALNDLPLEAHTFCDRAMTGIKQRVPLIEQRDKAEKERDEARAEVRLLRKAITDVLPGMKCQQPPKLGAWNWPWAVETLEEVLKDEVATRKSPLLTMPIVATNDTSPADAA